MKSNIVELTVVLLIFLFVFVTLVVFYEHKIDDLESEIDHYKSIVTVSE